MKPSVDVDEGVMDGRVAEGLKEVDFSGLEGVDVGGQKEEGGVFIDEEEALDRGLGDVGGERGVLARRRGLEERGCYFEGEGESGGVWVDGLELRGEGQERGRAGGWGRGGVGGARVVGG